MSVQVLHPALKRIGKVLLRTRIVFSLRFSHTCFLGVIELREICFQFIKFTAHTLESWLLLRRFALDSALLSLQFGRLTLRPFELQLCGDEFVLAQSHALLELRLDNLQALDLCLQSRLFGLERRQLRVQRPVLAFKLHAAIVRIDNISSVEIHNKPRVTNRVKEKGHFNSERQKASLCKRLERPTTW
ncbi:hypothetical protein KC319_g37 [Hortaea werneckii]|nr:hypothetical protein KC319_g37 [Hortaea werneckii]